MSVPRHTVSMLIFADICLSVYIKQVMSSSERGKANARLIRLRGRFKRM